MKRILVTGGAGFIGSHLVDQLIADGEKVIVVDNLSSGALNNINDKAIFYNLDISDRNLVEVFEHEKPEYVYHLAAQSNVTSSIENPEYDANINILGTINILNLCKQYSIRKIIYSSTAAVYGTPFYLGIDENHPINPNSFYAISKYTSEQYIKTYSRLYGIDYTILRYANVYGPRQNYISEGAVITSFINKLLNNEQPIIHGNGKQTRDFIYIKDVIEANILTLSKGSGQIFNIGTGVRISIIELLEIISKETGSKNMPRYVENRIGDIRDSFFWIEQAKSVLDWEPKYNLVSGLRETILYY